MPSSKSSHKSVSADRSGMRQHGIGVVVHDRSSDRWRAIVTKRAQSKKARGCPRAFFPRNRPVSAEQRLRRAEAPSTPRTMPYWPAGGSWIAVWGQSVELDDTLRKSTRTQGHAVFGAEPGARSRVIAAGSADANCADALPIQILRVGGFVGARRIGHIGGLIPRHTVCRVVCELSRMRPAFGPTRRRSS